MRTWDINLLIALLAAAAGLLAWPARAHEATNAAGEPSGWVYPGGCCMSAATSPTGDCAPIDSRTVHAVPGGYSITLIPGQHPKLITKGYSGVVPYPSARQSEDGDFHICLSTDGASRYCFFAPLPGV